MHGLCEGRPGTEPTSGSHREGEKKLRSHPMLFRHMFFRPVVFLLPFVIQSRGMKSFVLEAEGRIAVFASRKEALRHSGDRALVLSRQAEFSRLSADWPLSRFVDVWNCIPGVRRRNTFENRKTAVYRIWSALQKVEGGPAERRK